VYAILRARRAASTEAVVLSVPFRSKSSDMPQTYGGIIVMLGLAKYFMRKFQLGQNNEFMGFSRCPMQLKFCLVLGKTRLSNKVMPVRRWSSGKFTN
jgi:hypothetical protein